MSFFEKGEIKTLWRLYFGDFLVCSFSLVAAFGLIYFIGLGFSLTQIGLLFSVMGLAGFFFEIPTGAIADKYGRKFSVLLGAFLESCLILAIFFTKTYYSLLIIFLLMGIVGTLHSGAGESWIYDLLKKKNKKIIPSYYSKNKLFGSLGLIISGFLGAFFVAKIGIEFIWLISGLASFSYFLILLPLEEVYTRKKQHQESFKDLWIQSKQSVKYSVKHPVLFYLFLAGFFSVIAFAFGEGLGFLVHLKQLGLPEHAFGYFYSGTALILAISPLAAKFFKKDKKEIGFLITCTLLGSLALVFLIFVSSYLIAIIIMLFSLFFFGMKYPIERPFMQKFIPTEKRATILSVQAMFFSLAGAIALPVGGFIIDKFGPLPLILAASFVGIPTIILYLLIKEKVN